MKAKKHPRFTKIALGDVFSLPTKEKKMLILILQFLIACEAQEKLDRKRK